MKNEVRVPTKEDGQTDGQTEDALTNGKKR